MQKPNFCQSCGTSLGGSAPNKATRATSLEVEKEIFDSNLNGLEYEHIDFTPPTQTLGSIMEQSSNAGMPPPNNDPISPRNTLSPEETLEQLKKESSAIRPRSSN